MMSYIAQLQKFTLHFKSIVANYAVNVATYNGFLIALATSKDANHI